LISRYSPPPPPQAEVKQFLEKAHGLKVESVRTLNVEGKKKRSKTGFYRRVDYKKVFVTLKNGQTTTGAATAQQ
jgi:large subunit ribosomal protein L23